ncbi:MAG: hypothetical protein K5771_07715 [Oscillospiraceae bacterium]|nr:hypothetical protein [Oscillospiraceae bacterium]
MLSKLQMRALETCCYIVGAGAFGVFIRWLQNVAGTNDDQLYNDSLWSFLVPLVIIIGALVFVGMVRKLGKDRLYVDEDVCEALKNSGRIYQAIRIAIGVIMAAGSALLIAQCELDNAANLLRILGILGFSTGVSFPIMMKWYNQTERRVSLMYIFAMLPVIMFCVWLIATYKQNDINGVVWQYGVEIVAVCAAICAFFRAAGFSFYSVKSPRILFSSFFGAFILIVTLADERYLGQQIMILGSVGMLLYYDWVLIVNMKQKEAPLSYQPRDGFEHLYN